MGSILMSWYLILKFIHVAAVIAWLGGAGALIFAATLSARTEDRKKVIDVVTFLSNRLFIPSLGVVLLSGGVMWWVGALTFDAWVAYGLAGILVTGALGALVLGPTAERISHMAANNASPGELAPAISKLLHGAQADMLALASIVFAMVFKPTWSDTGMLLGMIIVVAAGAAYFLTRPAATA
jgi:uncharacterized membrane protein